TGNPAGRSQRQGGASPADAERAAAARMTATTAAARMMRFRFSREDIGRRPGARRSPAVFLRRQESGRLLGQLETLRQPGGEVLDRLRVDAGGIGAARREPLAHRAGE